MNEIPNYLTVKQFVAKHKAFSNGGMRWQIHKEESNGLKGSGAVIRNGARILIDEEKYFDWLIKRSEAQEEAKDE
jgi:hypothetical protein